MKRAVLVARILLGIIFVIFGLNGFFLFITPPEHTPAGGAFINLLVTTGFMYVEKSFEIIGGALVLLDLYVPLGLVILAPICSLHPVVPPANGAKYACDRPRAVSAVDIFDLGVSQAVRSASSAARKLLKVSPRVHSDEKGRSRSTRVSLWQAASACGGTAIR